MKTVWYNPYWNELRIIDDNPCSCHINSYIVSRGKGFYDSWNYVFTPKEFKKYISRYIKLGEL